MNPDPNPNPNRTSPKSLLHAILLYWLERSDRVVTLSHIYSCSVSEFMPLFVYYDGNFSVRDNEFELKARMQWRN